MCVAATFAPATALADVRDPAAAEALFRDARALANSGDYRAACPKFAESERLDPAPGTRFNLADCEEHVGQLASSWEHFRRVAEELPPDDDRVAYARAHAASLEPRLPHLTVVLAEGAPAGTRVARDGVDLGEASLGLAVPTNPGAHSIVVVAPGRVDRAVQVTLGEGESQRVVATPGAPAEAAPARPPTRGYGAGRTAGLVVGGAGVAAILTGAVFGVRALMLRSQSDADCNNGVCKDASGASAYKDAKTSARVADVSMGLGLVAAGVGAYLVLSSRVGLEPHAVPGGTAMNLRVAW
jgi:hypothetical protein